MLQGERTGKGLSVSRWHLQFEAGVTGRRRWGGRVMGVGGGKGREALHKPGLCGHRAGAWGNESCVP